MGAEVSSPLPPVEEISDEEAKAVALAAPASFSDTSTFSLQSRKKKADGSGKPKFNVALLHETLQDGSRTSRKQRRKQQQQRFNKDENSLLHASSTGEGEFSLPPPTIRVPLSPLQQLKQGVEVLYEQLEVTLSLRQNTKQEVEVMYEHSEEGMAGDERLVLPYQSVDASSTGTGSRASASAGDLPVVHLMKSSSSGPSALSDLDERSALTDVARLNNKTMNSDERRLHFRRRYEERETIDRMTFYRDVVRAQQGGSVDSRSTQEASAFDGVERLRLQKEASINDAIEENRSASITSRKSKKKRVKTQDEDGNQTASSKKFESVPKPNGAAIVVAEVVPKPSLDDSSTIAAIAAASQKYAKSARRAAIDPDDDRSQNSFHKLYKDPSGVIEDPGSDLEETSYRTLKEVSVFPKIAKTSFDLSERSKKSPTELVEAISLSDQQIAQASFDLSEKNKKYPTEQVEEIINVCDPEISKAVFDLSEKSKKYPIQQAEAITVCDPANESREGGSCRQEDEAILDRDTVESIVPVDFDKCSVTSKATNDDEKRSVTFNDCKSEDVMLGAMSDEGDEGDEEDNSGMNNKEEENEKDESDDEVLAEKEVNNNGLSEKGKSPMATEDEVEEDIIVTETEEEESEEEESDDEVLSEKELDDDEVSEQEKSRMAAEELALRKQFSYRSQSSKRSMHFSIGEESRPIVDANGDDDDELSELDQSQRAGEEMLINRQFSHLSRSSKKSLHIHIDEEIRPMTARPSPLTIFDQLEDRPPVDYPESADANGVDVRFVDEYERLFDSFLQSKPEIAERSPEFMEYLKIIKLQKILEASTEMEKELQQRVEEAQQRKDDTAQAYQTQIAEYVRLQTSCDELVQEQLDAARQNMMEMKANLTWKCIEATRARAQRQQDIILHLVDQKEETEDVMSLLPDLPETQRLQTLLTSSTDDVSERNMIQYQIEKSFLQSEAIILETQTQNLFSEAKKHAWVDGVFLQLTPEELVQFKEVYYKQMGVQQL
jgi:hypothetical protein